MNSFKLVPFFAVILLFSCSARKNSTVVEVEKKEMITEKTIWVNSTLHDCIGLTPKTCMQIQENDTIDQTKWELFYDEIKGFNYEPGYIYRLKISEANLDMKTIPADQSSKAYTLLEVLEKNRDLDYYKINDLWALHKIKGNNVDSLTEKPFLEVNLSKMNVQGKGSCNNFMSKINTYALNEIQLGPLAATKMMCPEIALENEYFSALSSVRFYKIKNLNLFFYNEMGEEVLHFKKVD